MITVFVNERDNVDEGEKEDEEDPNHDNSVCKKEAWRCLSSIVETGIHCFGKSEGFME